MTTGLLERLDRGVVLGDGGYLLELERRGWVQAGPFTPEVSIEHPEALLELHREFARAGADVLQALTFYASEDKLATVGLAGFTAFVVLMGKALSRLRRRAIEGPWSLEAAALSASLAGFLVHGLFDYLLAFTPIYLAVFTLLGAASAAIGGEVRS